MSRHDATGGTTFPGPLPQSLRAAERWGLGELRHVVSTGSTNRDLAGEARRGSTNAAVLVADHQTAGRGRRDRTWDDVDGGALLVSVRLPVVAVSGHDLVAVLVAAARAACEAVCSVPVAAKWPNDLVVEQGSAPGKLGGVLSELVTGSPDVIVIGIGINLAPVPGQPAATSIAECGGPTERDPLLAAILAGFGARRDDPEAARSELRAASATLGRRVRVDIGSSTLIGTATDLTDDGRLVLATEDGEQIISAGDVVHLRPSDEPEGD
jgi:BirA family biotin operon repressor/biotin-[acetyl-CoA-carboxylase] ligase